MYRIIILRLLESYFRHRWLYLLPIVLMMVFAGVYLATLTPDYIANGVLYVNDQSLLASLTAIRDNNANWWITPSQATTNEINELLRTDAFVRAIVLQTGLESKMSEGPGTVDEVIDYVRRSVWVSPLGSNQVQVNASDPQAETAYELVNASISSYIQWKMNTERADSLAAQEFLIELIEEYGEDLENARQALKNYTLEHPEPIRGERPYVETLEIQRLNGDIRLAEERYSTALQKEEDVKISLRQIEAEARQTYVLIDAPLVPREPDLSLKKLGLNAAVFLAVGIFFTAAMVIGSAVIDRTYRFPADITFQLELPVLAAIQDATPKQPGRLQMLKSRIKSWRLRSRRSEDPGIEPEPADISFRDQEKEADAPA